MNLTTGTNRVFVRSASRLFEFDQTGKYVREIGQGLYGFIQAHAVRVDPQDNIWVVDEGSNMVIKFDPEGRVLMTLGRKPEAINNPVRAGGSPGSRQRRSVFPETILTAPPTWRGTLPGDIFVADGSRPSRVAKFDKNGVYIKSWGGRGKRRANSALRTRSSWTPKKTFMWPIAAISAFKYSTRMAISRRSTPTLVRRGLCASPPGRISISTRPIPIATISTRPPSTRWNSTAPLLGKFGAGGKQLKEFGTVHEMDCRKDNELYVGEITNWRVQKLTLHPEKDRKQPHGSGKINASSSVGFPALPGPTFSQVTFEGRSFERSFDRRFPVGK